MKGSDLLCIALTILATSFSVHGRQKIKFIQIVYYRQCDANRSIINSANVHGVIVDRNLILSGYLDLLEDIDENMKLSRTIESCLINAPFSPCIPFGKYGLDDFCGSLKRADNLFGKYFSKNVEPKIVCPPLKKGRYNFLNITVDLGPFMDLPVENKEWKQQILFRTVKSGRIVFCATSIAKVFAQSSRRKV